MYKKINITIDNKGNVAWEVKGVKGSSCVKETNFLEEALGGKIIDREETDEYYSDYQLVVEEQNVGSGSEE